MSPTKTLRSFTIIPPDLYVERSADAQLQRTIEDMGRPGYILVARQMGKTNLLLNAKRKLGTASDKFAYIDISNSFSSIRDFFHNIIDTVFDSHQDIADAIRSSTIEKRSSKTPLPPHKEHENELRSILKTTGGKLVICLDEIDALTKTGYADQVFSFIRSTYFSGRVNFPEFSRLTYVLSGVAEPSELIKDKTVSPFNIGEKIYLDDFTANEFYDFIRKSNLQFNESIIQRIYYWTSGNPRISWDVCSGLEDLYQRGDDISETTVDATVAEMYLTNFDLPPIDHIRTLVEDDRTIRDAIMSIHYGKSDSISDSVRSRLYLSGITKPEQGSGRKVLIRNRILSESLSESWIYDVERRKLPAYELANKRYDAGMYVEALSLYEDYITSTNTPEEPAFLYYKIGNCQYILERYQEAILSFEKCNIKKEHAPSLYYAIKYKLGLAHLLHGNNAHCINIFKEILEQSTSNEHLYFYFDSCLNLSSALFQDFDENREEIVRLNNLVIALEPRVRICPEGHSHANYLLNFAHFNLARVAKKIGDLDSARAAIAAAAAVADERMQVFLAMEASDIAPGKVEKAKILEQCVSDIVLKRISVRKRNKENALDFNVDVCARLIERLADNLLDPELEAICLFINDKEIEHEANSFEILGQSAYSAISKGNSAAAVKIIDRLISYSHGKEEFIERRNLLTLAILLSPFPDADRFIRKYWNDYINTPDALLVNTDIRLAWSLYQSYSAQGVLDEIPLLVIQIRELMNRTWNCVIDGDEHKKYIAGKLLLDLIDLEVAIQKKERGTRKKAVEILSQMDNIHSFPFPYFSEDILSQINSRLLAISSDVSLTSTVKREGRKLGRNEKILVRFKDGKIIEDKYKHLEDPIKNGMCTIIKS